MSGHRARPPSQRQLRVGEELRHALARILERGTLRDPGLEGITVTVTEVRMSPDLRRAHVFVTPLGGGPTTPVLEALTRARPFLRRQIARSVDLRNVPDMDFVADGSFDEGTRIETLLADPMVARDLNDTRDDDTEDEDESHGL
ncbi:MAG: 30S ribosome-binding factor RbfA [Rhodospirillales bacterium]|jgi:ribosome-binding factor A|nr:30S ribosome-binding factor RbfA [Rhodospirillales bacterium]MDP7650318.1 30S ribosome-binding factor RbfA [Rhodospirillales bacterium]HJO96504.1 30S ribosome-binding factor RbfA [Rhodospirillales bacterium]